MNMTNYQQRYESLIVCNFGLRILTATIRITMCLAAIILAGLAVYAVANSVVLGNNVTASTTRVALYILLVAAIPVLLVNLPKRWLQQYKRSL